MNTLNFPGSNTFLGPFSRLCLWSKSALDSVFANYILVQEEVYDEFAQKLMAAVKRDLTLGNGMKEGVTVGPLIDEKAAGDVLAMIAEGAPSS